MCCERSVERSVDRTQIEEGRRADEVAADPNSATLMLDPTIYGVSLFLLSLFELRPPRSGASKYSIASRVAEAR